MIPDTKNIALSAHYYTEPPDRDSGKDEFTRRTQGYLYAQNAGIPLWAGEFGPVFTPTQDEIPDKLQSLDTQIKIFEETGTHYTLWTYKEKPHSNRPYSSMGLVSPAPVSLYAQAIEPIEKKKIELRTDWWMERLPKSETVKAIEVGIGLNPCHYTWHRSQAITRLPENLPKKSYGYGKPELQEQWVQIFAEMTPMTDSAH